jgi:hypothetical protein
MGLNGVSKTKRAVALVAQCTVLAMMAANMAGISGDSQEVVPYTYYSEWADVMWDVATLSGRRDLGAPSVWHQSIICLSADWAASKFRQRFRVPKELAESLVYGLTVSTGTFRDNDCQNPLHRCVIHL